MASNFIASYVTFQNTFGAGHQAVALRVSGDRAAFYGCSMIGYQDTLFHKGRRHYYEDCYIEGVADYIFGTSMSLFQSCNIHAKAAGYITAQRRDWPADNVGFVFVNGLITAGEGVKTYLGRPWGGDYPMVIFAYTEMGDAIEPKGWFCDDKTEDDLKKKAYCGQFRCVGASSNTSKRSLWAREFTEEEVAKFLTVDFIDGKDWLKSTTLSSSPMPPSTAKEWWWGPPSPPSRVVIRSMDSAASDGPGIPMDYTSGASSLRYSKNVFNHIGEKPRLWLTVLGVQIVSALIYLSSI